MQLRTTPQNMPSLGNFKSLQVLYVTNIYVQMPIFNFIIHFGLKASLRCQGSGEHVAWKLVIEHPDHFDPIRHL